MNTSKSLDEILNSYRYWASGGKRNSKKLTHQEAKAAIVEAVEGLIGPDEHLPGTHKEQSYDTYLNVYKKELRQAIKEWQ